VITSPEEHAAESRIREINGELRAIESAIDLEAWKKLFHEKLSVEQSYAAPAAERARHSAYEQNIRH
jgi:hypothetical protein